MVLPLYAQCRTGLILPILPPSLSRPIWCSIITVFVSPLRAIMRSTPCPLSLRNNFTPPCVSLLPIFTLPAPSLSPLMTAFSVIKNALTNSCALVGHSRAAPLTRSSSSVGTLNSPDRNCPVFTCLVAFTVCLSPQVLGLGCSHLPSTTLRCLDLLSCRWPVLLRVVRSCRLFAFGWPFSGLSTTICGPWASIPLAMSVSAFCRVRCAV